MSRDVARTSCRYCGRTWDHTGRSRTAIPSRRGGSNAFGFVLAARNVHEETCKRLTPEQRAAANRKAEARWKANPPRSYIWNDPNHPGVADLGFVDRCEGGHGRTSIKKSHRAEGRNFVD